MLVTLADTLIEVRGWTPDLDEIGAFTLRVRKTPAELKAERELQKTLPPGSRRKRIQPEKLVPNTCISKDPEDPSLAFFLPGLWPRVKARLDKLGRPYQLADRRNPEIRPRMDLSVLQGVSLRCKQDLALALIEMSDCGIIKATTAFGKSFLIGLICKAYPTLNIVVTTDSVQVVSTLCEYLRQQIPGEVGQLGGGRDTSAGKRVVVSTLKSLPNISPENVQLLLVDECHCVGMNEAGKAVMQFSFARRFGFSASPVRNDGSALMMEAILGPVIMEMGYQEAVDAGSVTPMKYHMLHCTGCPQAAKSESLPDVFRKRYSYWVNSSRNRAIADFVRGLKDHYDGQILIMVSTLEHAIRLHLMLPWFRVAYYGSTDLNELRAKFPPARFPGLDLASYKMPAKQLEITRRAFAKGTLRYCISTKVFRQGVNFTHLACLVRADGDTSEIEGIQIPGRLSRLDEGKDCAYLVDIDDRFSRWASYRADRREALYRKQGWTSVTYQELIDGIGNGTEKDGGDAAAEPAG